MGIGCLLAPCSSQVPGYIAKHDEFVAKGVSDIYVVAVNDIVRPYTLLNTWEHKY